MIAHTRVETIGRCLPPESGKFCTLFYTSGPPIDYPNRIYVFTKPPIGQLCNATDPVTGNESKDPIAQPHASTERSIRRACHFYADSAENHLRRLWVQGCNGRTYAECFVLLGAEDEAIVGTWRIFYAQIRFTSPIRFEAEPLVIPLLSTVDGEYRSVAIHTKAWAPGQREDLIRQIRKHIHEGRTPHRIGSPSPRPWIFFVAPETAARQIQFKTFFHAGVDTLSCRMPKQHRRLRDWALAGMPMRQSHPDGVQDSPQPSHDSAYTPVFPQPEPVSFAEDSRAAKPEDLLVIQVVHPKDAQPESCPDQRLDPEVQQTEVLPVPDSPPVFKIAVDPLSNAEESPEMPQTQQAAVGSSGSGGFTICKGVEGQHPEVSARTRAPFLTRIRKAVSRFVGW